MRALPFLLAVALVSCGGEEGGTSGAGGTEPPELAGITAAHNQVRAGVGVAPLVWDDALARTAAAWVARCVDEAPPAGLVDHNPDRSDGHSTYVGENIYASTGDATGPAAVAAWAGEAVNYHLDSNTCDAGAVCGHYTQVVWRDTERVGCAKHVCSALAYPSTIVCDYGPGGNIEGQRPY